MNTEEMSDMLEIMCRNHYQVWVCEVCDSNHIPMGFGSGFMVLHRGHLYYVTADHVVNAECEHFKLDPHKDYIASIPTNVIDRKNLLSQQVVCPINREDKIEVLKINENTVSEEGRVDLYYINMDNHLHTKFLTQGLIFSESDVRYAGAQKVFLSEDNIDRRLDISHTFSVFGMVGSRIVNGIYIDNIPIFHNGMTFKEEKYDQYCFEVSRNDEHLKMEHWAGLSGAAVFDECTGKVIGMALQYSEDYNLCWVMPIQQIFAIIEADILTRSMPNC